MYYNDMVMIISQDVWFNCLYIQFKKYTKTAQGESASFRHGLCNIFCCCGIKCRVNGTRHVFKQRRKCNEAMAIQGKNDDVSRGDNVFISR